MSLINLPCAETIVHQMKNNVCKIKIKNTQGTGFFCRIPFPFNNKFLNVLFTCNHIINYDLLNKEDTKIFVSLNNDSIRKELNLNNRIKYTNEEYDVTIIEIKESDNITNYLELDDFLLQGISSDEIKNDIFIDESIYIIEYIEGEVSVSSNKINNISERKYIFTHQCHTGNGAAGSPILSVKNNKVIGIHHSVKQNMNFGLGTFLNYPLKEFITICKSKI